MRGRCTSQHAPHPLSRQNPADWLHRYNHHRPHESLGRVPPVEYRIKQFPNLYQAVEKFSATARVGRYDLKPSKNDPDEKDERQPRLPRGDVQLHQP
ncbi:MAG: integrase core domain-containing protein [Ramlibacter sp.]|nr:integrase core domain-containing protein [Ramlibacter sp.]